MPGQGGVAREAGMGSAPVVAGRPGGPHRAFRAGCGSFRAVRPLSVKSR